MILDKCSVAFVSSGAAMLAMGCADETDISNDEDTATTKGALASAFGYTSSGAVADDRYTDPWRSPGVVNLRFTAPNYGTPRTDLVGEVMDTLANSWGAVTGLTFVNTGTCARPAPASSISIFLADVVSARYPSNGAAIGGVGNRFVPSPTDSGNIDYRADIQMYLGLRTATNEYRRQTAHEFGHALGFYHERERVEETGVNCFDRDENGLPIPGGNTRGEITGYDFDSIMNWSYCATVRTESDLLSDGDKLGAEMMYPKKSSGYGLACGSSCFGTGRGAIVRSDGSVTIDWVSRGADVDPVWTVGSTAYMPSSGMLSAAYLSNDATTAISMTFPDAFSNPNLGMYAPVNERNPLLLGGGSVTKSDSVHTALAMAILAF